MPSSIHPQAKFDPLPPDLNLQSLVEKAANFDYVIRIPVDQITNISELEHLVLMHVVIGGKPLVLEGWNSKLPPWMFNPDWLIEHVGKKEENVRDISNSANVPMTIGHYLNHMGKLTNQWSPTNFRDPKRQRLYLKDIDCPEEWHQHLKDIIPENLFYLNDSVGEKGGPGAAHERNMYNQVTIAKGIASAGDLMSNLPEEMRAENMMCYIGHEGTYTPAHREMCATLGQNIMVETSTSENGEQPGSSIWFMTESKDREVVSEYFLSMLGHDIEVESHFAQINAWKKAPFPVYIVEQKAGDFILIPPLAPHQVWNRGTRTMKAAWNRTTVETLELALHEALPRARMVCRDEQYKCKATVYYSLLRYYDQLKRMDPTDGNGIQRHSDLLLRNSPRVRQLQKDFKRLFDLYTEILVSEMFSPGLPKEKHVEFIPFDSNITCSYCRCNIFNRFLTCKTCVEVLEDGEQDTYDICMECYAMGRSCACISGLKWVEQWQWSVLTMRYQEWHAIIISNDRYVNVNSLPQSLEVARTLYGKKPVAQICQEQLRLRPKQDPNSEPLALSPRAMIESESPEPEVDDEGRIKKRKTNKRKSGRQKGGLVTNCHICCHTDWNWKLAFCTTCPMAYCYGTLWRAFDLKPQTVMEQADWKCPKCLGICGCGACRRKGNDQKEPYRPKGTLLGHDTRRVADPRSVESLVDFRRTNLTWLRGEGDHDPKSSMRMQKLVHRAQEEKAKDEILEQEFIGNSNETTQASLPYESDQLAIDPTLWEHGPSTTNNSNYDVTNGGFSGELANGSEDVQFDLLNHMDHDHAGHRRTEYVNPTSTMHMPDQSYPDPSVLGRDRMMGIGYYQQSNDADRILFDHPDSGSNSNVASSTTPFPQGQLEPSNKKRKADNMLPNHENIKRQKLAEAKRDGTLIMTKHKLEGGGPMIVKLHLKNPKHFLRHLDELDKSTDMVRQNSRPSRLGHDKKAIDPFLREMSDVDDGGMFVPLQSDQPANQSQSEETPRSPLRPQAQAALAVAEEATIGNGRKVRGETKARLAAITSAKRTSKQHSPQVPAPSPPSIAEKQPRGQPQATRTRTKYLEHQSISNPEQSPPQFREKPSRARRSSNRRKQVDKVSISSPEQSPLAAMEASVQRRQRGRQRKTLAKGQDPAELSHASPRIVPTLAMSPKEAMDLSPSISVEGLRAARIRTSASASADISKKPKDSSRRVSFHEPAQIAEAEYSESHESEDFDVGPSNGKYGAPVDQYYLNLKMEALREIEAEEAARKTTKGTPEVTHVQKSTSGTTPARIPTPQRSSLSRSLQHKQAPSFAKEPALSEHNVLQGKNIKNNGMKPLIPGVTLTTTATSELLLQATNPITSLKFTPSGSGILSKGNSRRYAGSISGSSSSDGDFDDSSIPAHRPGTFPSSRGGKSGSEHGIATTALKVKPQGMLQGMQRGGGMFGQKK